MNQPKEFAGSEAEARANRATHYFGSEGRCVDCDCRPWGRVADYPCGASVPRVEVEAGPDYMLAGAIAWAPLGENS